MQNYIATFTIVVISIMTLVVNTDVSTYARTTKYIKEDLEIAVHDASLMIDKEQYAEGRIVFDETKSLDAFKDSLRVNSKLEEGDYRILDFKRYDHSNTTFPTTFKSDVVEIEETIVSPTILVVIEIDRKRYFNPTKSKPVVRSASYSYKVRPDSDISGLGFNTNGVSNGEFVWAVPFTTNVTSGFSPARVNPVTGVLEAHKGMDIASAGVENQPVVAVQGGRVTYAGNMGSYGNLVEIQHTDGLVTRYAHLNAIHVGVGDEVRAGTIIGRVGSTGESTGAHLHLEVIKNGLHIDPQILYNNGS